MDIPEKIKKELYGIAEDVYGLTPVGCRDGGDSYLVDIKDSKEALVIKKSWFE